MTWPSYILNDLQWAILNDSKHFNNVKNINVKKLSTISKCRKQSLIFDFLMCLVNFYYRVSQKHSYLKYLLWLGSRLFTFGDVSRDFPLATHTMIIFQCMCLNYYCTCDHTTNKFSGTHICKYSSSFGSGIFTFGNVSRDSSLIIGQSEWCSFHLYQDSVGLKRC